MNLVPWASRLLLAAALGKVRLVAGVGLGISDHGCNDLGDEFENLGSNPVWIAACAGNDIEHVAGTHVAIAEDGASGETVLRLKDERVEPDAVPGACHSADDAGISPRVGVVAQQRIVDVNLGVVFVNYAAGRPTRPREGFVCVRLVAPRYEATRLFVRVSIPEERILSADWTRAQRRGKRRRN